MKTTSVLVLAGLLPLGVLSTGAAVAASPGQSTPVVAADGGAPTRTELQRMNERIRQLEADQKRLEAQSQQEEEKSGGDWLMKGHDGRLSFETRDGRNAFAIQGRLQMDSTVSSNDRAATGGDSPVGNTALRRARIRAVGTIDQDWDYVVQYELTSGSIDDAYLAYTGFGFDLFGAHTHSEIIAGNQFDAFGFHVSSKYRNYLENSLPVDTFRPGRELGFSYRAWQKHWNFWTSFGGGYGPGDAPSLGGGDEAGGTSQYTASARLAINLINEDGHVLQIGNSIAYRNIINQRNVTYNRFRARPGGSRGFDQRLVDTGVLDDISDEVIYSPDLAFQDGPLDFTANYYRTHISLGGAAASPTFTGWAAQAGYFLTPGDARSFSSGSAAFGRVHPKHPVNKGGVGAWQVAARGEQVDLSDAGIDGGKMTDIVAALNWWALSNIRFQLQYINTLKVDGGPNEDEKPQIYALRMQYDF